MIGDDDVDAAVDGAAHRIDAGDAAVDGDDQPHLALNQHAVEHFGLEAVAVDEAVRDDVRGVRAEGSQHGLQQDDGCDAVDVVVAVDEDGLAVAHRALDARARRRHAVDGRRIMQIGNRRGHELPELIVRGDAAPHEDRSQRRMRDGDARVVGSGVGEDPGVVDGQSGLLEHSHLTKFLVAFFGE